MRKFPKEYSITILIAVLIITVWESLTRMGSLNPIIFPPSEKIFSVFIGDGGKQLLQGLVSSFKLLFPAYLGSIIFGISGGVYLGLNRKVRTILMPYVHLLSPLPPTLFVPYAIAVLPSFQSASIFLIFIGTFWPIFLGALQGVLIIEKHYLDNSKMLGLKGKDFLLKVVLPAASPHILSGAGTALIMSFLILTMAEMFGAESGMGYFIQYYTDFAQYNYVIAGMIFNCVIILTALVLFERLKKRILFWTNLKADSDRKTAK
ncbi:ABC transporter permease [Rummeliibacillus suwonensis]|uniref:ABC transporter permease n=1 Tax=Rummeliibacillus suwonensis TaxID=1306154 RepID=UPI0011B655DD|nr:ABC transporter permease subunit [Rummeliibacillus suwonensis]MBO2536882.1 ABC transporter permease subunit [Rummeliibacillus suwonensis]